MAKFKVGDNFNSHARVGRDPADMEKALGKKNFNSHARVGRDCLYMIETQGLPSNFNSHARVGRDPQFWRETEKAVISTHTPV